MRAKGKANNKVILNRQFARKVDRMANSCSPKKLLEPHINTVARAPQGLYSQMQGNSIYDLIIMFRDWKRCSGRRTTKPIPGQHSICIFVRVGAPSPSSPNRHALPNPSTPSRHHPAPDRLTALQTNVSPGQKCPIYSLSYTQRPEACLLPFSPKVSGLNKPHSPNQVKATASFPDLSPDVRKGA